MREDEKTVTIKFLLEEYHQELLDNEDFDELYREFPLITRPLTEILVDDLGIDLKIIVDSLTVIPDNFCEGRKSLKTLDLSGAIEIGNSAFYKCGKLASVTMGDNVRIIGGWAFRNCQSLTSVTIPDSVTSIGSNAFWGCKHLKSITIPNSVMSIGEYAFGCCASLVINYGGTTARFGEITDWGWNAMSKEITLRSISGSLVYR